MSAYRRRAPALDCETTASRPDRRQKLQQVVRAELTLMRSVTLKFCACLLVAEGLIRIAAISHPAPSGAATVAASRPQTARGGEPRQVAGMQAVVPRLPQAALKAQ
jgi:hypothetical protein